MEHIKNETKPTSRIEAFSDGVFAIVITLLVLELIQTFHAHSDEGLIKTFLHNWQSFLSFSIGFITVLICWINHHIALEYVRKVNTKFMWINGSLLFLVTLTPFSTAILAEYFEKDSQTALSIFVLNYLLISIAADCICTYAYNHHLIEEKHRKYYHSFKLIYRFAIFYAGVVFLLCFVSIIIPIILYALLFVAFAVPKEFALRLDKIRIKRKPVKRLHALSVSRS